MKINRIISLLILIVLLISCRENKKNEKIINKTTVLKNIQKETLVGIWNLYKVNDTLFDIEIMYGFKADKPTLKIDSNRKLISGFSGCNGYGGKAKIETSKIILTEGITATQMGCGDNKWENDFFSRLNDIESYQLKNDTLKLQNSTNKSMTFLKRHLHLLELNNWELTKVNDTIFDIKKVYGNKYEPQPNIIFNLEKNTIGGWNGCNNFSLAINFRENYYSSGNYQSDARRCYKGWLEKFNGILAENKSYRIENGILTLISLKGKTLTFRKLKH